MKLSDKLPRALTKYKVISAMTFIEQSPLQILYLPPGEFADNR